MDRGLAGNNERRFRRKLSTFPIEWIGGRWKKGCIRRVYFQRVLRRRQTFVNNRPHYQSLKLRDTERSSLTLQSSRALFRS